MLNQPFFQITLPLMATFIATIWIAQWSQNKRLDELSKRLDEGMASVNRRIDEVIKRLERIEAKLEDHAGRITTLETAKWR